MKINGYILKIKKLGACEEAVLDAHNYKTSQELWDDCERGDWMLWLIGKLSGEPENDKRKKLVLTTCECARLALPFAGKNKEVAKKAIETAEKWAKNKATIKEVKAAAYAAYTAYAAAAYAAYAAYAAAYAADAAAAYAVAAAADAAYTAYAAAAYAAYAAYAAAYAADAAAAYAAYAAAYAVAAAAYAAYAAAYAADAAAKSKILKKCAKIVRKNYPKVDDLFNV